MRGRISWTEASDAELAALAASGDGQAFEALVRRHSAAVRGLLRRMGAREDVADDIAQEAFIAAFRRISAYRGDGSMAAWLKQIAARLYVRRWRAEARYDLTETPEHEADEGPGPDGLLDLDQALNGLAPAERLCVSLCTGAGFSHPEAAALLNIPAGTVKSHVKRGLDKLRKRLAPPAEGRARSGLDV